MLPHYCCTSAYGDARPPCLVFFEYRQCSLLRCRYLTLGIRWIRLLTRELARSLSHWLTLVERRFWFFKEMQTIEQRKPVSGFHLITFEETASTASPTQFTPNPIKDMHSQKEIYNFLFFPFRLITLRTNLFLVLLNTLIAPLVHRKSVNATIDPERLNCSVVYRRRRGRRFAQLRSDHTPGRTRKSWKREPPR